MKATVIYGRLVNSIRRPAEGAFAVILNSDGLELKIQGLDELRTEEVVLTDDWATSIAALLARLPNPYPLSRYLSVTVIADDNSSGSFETDTTIPRVVPGDAHKLEIHF